MIDLDYVDDEFILLIGDRSMAPAVTSYPWQTVTAASSSTASYPEYEIINGYNKLTFSDNYQTVSDITSCEWYDDMIVHFAAQDRILAWESTVDTVNKFKNRLLISDNSENYFGYQYDTGCVGRSTKSLFINDATGLGKTRSALSVLDNNYRSGTNLIVCPKMAVNVWVNELKAVFSGFDYIVIEGNKKERESRLRHIQDVDFVIINYDLLQHHVSYPHWPGSSKSSEIKELDNISWHSVILDESHRIKSPKALRTRCCWTLSKYATYRMALTATPMTLDPQDLWAQLRFLLPKEFPNIGNFRRRFLHMEKGFHGGFECKGWNVNGAVDYEHVMGWRTTRRTFEDPKVSKALSHMTVPEEGPLMVHNVPLGDSQRRKYKAMVKRLMTVDDDGVPLIAKNTAEQFVRLRQIANGTPVIVEDHNGNKTVVGLNSPSSKARAVESIVADADCNVVVFAEHSKVVGMLQRHLDEHIFDASIEVITGDTRLETRLSIVKHFQMEDDRKKILICTTGTMSESVSLTNAGLVIFAQEPASLREMIQCRGRVRRIGSTVVVPSICIRSEGTVEISLADGMKQKQKFLTDYLTSNDPSYNNVKDILEGTTENEWIP